LSPRYNMRQYLQKGTVLHSWIRPPV
jgi:hypothetical protein